ncbi:hypothetical protein LTR50_005828 [Elasticomyces elasticus]|nr:hypothetical protein LTR50_005828 [Elasticomyces elasticus]
MECLLYLCLFACGTFFALAYKPDWKQHFNPSYISSQSGYGFRLYEHLGNLSPYFTPGNEPPSLKSGVPPTCTVHRLFLTVRHGSRQPISEELPVIQNLSYYINNNSALFSNPQATVPLAFAFLAEDGWTSTFSLDNLTAPGRLQEFTHGVDFRLRYPQLYTNELLAGGQDRVVESAQWFANGYYGRYANETAKLNIIGENNKTISWITPMDTCANWSYSSGNDLVVTWGTIYLPRIAHRINKLLGPVFPGVNFTPGHAHAMLYACAYGTAVYGLDASPWCPVFTSAEILDFEYELDLLMRGAFGYGLPNGQGPVLGSLLVSNMTSFMTSNASTSANVSLNFAHDTTIDLGLTALGLAFDAEYPATGPPDPNRKWRTSRQVAFAAEMMWSRLRCANGTRLQLMLDEANFDLSPVGCTADAYGTCALDDFLATGKVRSAEAVRHGDARWVAACGE